MTRFNPFAKLDCRYGAPMGRHSTRHDFCGVRRFAVSRPQGEYDCGGAYWAVAGVKGQCGLFGSAARAPKAFATCAPSAVPVRLPERAAVKVCYDLSGEAFTPGFALPRKVLYG